MSDDFTHVFAVEALKKFPCYFKMQGDRILHTYKKGWRTVKPFSSCCAKIEGFPNTVIISGSKVKRGKCKA